METIRIENLSFRYPLSEKMALKNINLSIEESSFIVVCGRSGSGKSTLLRHLKKNLTPYGEKEGKACYRGQDIYELDDRVNASKIGYVQQNPDNQIVTDKVWHELAFGLESLGYDSSTIRRRVAEMASFFDMQGWFRKDTAELSGGQKQLLNLASIMVMQPEVLVLDEPTAQLDPIAASEFIQMLYRINRELGTTVIISEHRLGELFSMADRVVLMDEGEILSFEEPWNTGEILAEKNHPMILGLPSVMRIYQEAGGKGHRPMNVRDGRMWLDEMLGDVSAECEREKKNSCERSVLSLKNIYYRYDRKSGQILRNLTLDIHEGEWYSLLGGNGTGKSTLLKVISGILKPQDGSVSASGKISMVPQNPQALFTEITLEEELLEALIYEKMSDEDKIAEVRSMIEVMQLEGLEKSHPYDLSGGEQQRLAIGKILLLKPEVLLLDEPTKGLDPFFKAQLAQILRELKEKKMTILMVSHDLDFCAEYSDRCGMIFDGSLVCEDEPAEFFSGNSFYTTEANQMARKWFPKAVTCGEVAECIRKMT